MSFIDGLSSGLDTSSIINQLMQIERRPQAVLSSRKNEEEAARTELTEIRSEINSLRNAAADLRLGSGWDRLVATSSNEEAVTVEATSSATTGSYSFQVTSVATAASVYSTNVYASTDDAVAAPGATVFSASNYAGLGFQSLDGTGFAEGAIDFSVVQASAAATLEGGNIPTIPIDVDGTNDNIDFEVNGFSFSVAMVHGNYNSEADLAAAVQQAINADAGASQVAKASLNASNQLTLSTVGEGSDNAIIITGGNAMASLGFTLGATAIGVDGIVEVDGTQTTVTDASAGTAVNLPGGAGGSIAAVLSGPLREGTATVEQAGFGTGSLADVVATVNNADLDYTAAAVNTGNGYRLQLIAKESGAASAFTPDPAVFGATAFTTLSAGTDAELTIQGTGGNAGFTIASSTNTFESLLPGVNITVNATTTTPVTVTTERDLDAVSESMNEVVTKLNDVLSRIATSTSNQPDGAKSVLQGNRAARRAADALLNAFVAPMDSNSFTSVGVVGIELTREGTLTFNQDKFREAFLNDPQAMSDLFTDRTAQGDAGALDRLIEAAESAASVGDGFLYTAGQSSERRIDDYGKQIEAFERRFEVREATLRRTYANLEVALGGLQQQSGYLASQLGSLGG